MAQVHNPSVGVPRGADKSAPADTNELENDNTDRNFHGSVEQFDGLTPMSPSVWNTYNQEPTVDSDLAKYIFRDAYLIDADRSLLQTDSRMFTVPLDDLASTQRRALSPLMSEREEEARRNYAEAVTRIAVSKGVAEYMLQLLSLQKLRESVKTVERAVSLDMTISKPSSDPSIHPWRFRGIFLPYQRSYKTGFTNSIWSLDVQGGWTQSQGDQLFTAVSARWGKYLQSNTFQIFTKLFSSSFTYFLKEDLALTFATSKDFSQLGSATAGTTQAIGTSYIF